MLLINLVILGAALYVLSKVYAYRARILTALRAFWTLYNLSPQQIDSFMNSYDLFDHDKVTNNDSLIVDYYSVLNQLCALGEVEKMYIPPTMDPKEGVFANQILFERKMMNDLGLPLDGKAKDLRVLDIGCGRGRIAAHVAETSGSNVYGINIDSNQVENAKKHAETKGMSERLNFQVRNFNEPLPFPDNFFNAVYEVQVFTYAKDFEKLFSEIHRVMKPGAKLSLLDWVAKEKYDPNNEYQRNLLKKIKPLLGAVYTPSIKELTTAMEKVGFKVILSKDASLEGHQDNLILKADKYYTTLQVIIDVAVAIKILPQHFKTLFHRFTKDAKSFAEADKLGLFTSSYQIVAQKI